MSNNRTIYSKYHEKMQRLLKTCDMGQFMFVPDSAFDEFSAYFVKTIAKEPEFKLYRYCGTKRYNKEKKEFEFSFNLNHLYLGTNGMQNDIFEGLPLSDYDIHSIDECINELSNLACLKCFTETPRNNLMWSHYADSYKGICIEYDIKKADDYVKKMLFPVIYSKNRRIYASVDGLVDYDNGDRREESLVDCKGIFLQKSYYWKYEQEWRICKMNHERRARSEVLYFPYVSAIYLGPRICNEDQSEILKQIKEYNGSSIEQIRVYKTSLCEDTYDLNFKEYY